MYQPNHPSNLPPDSQAAQSHQLLQTLYDHCVSTPGFAATPEYIEILEKNLDIVNPVIKECSLKFCALYFILQNNLDVALLAMNNFPLNPVYVAPETYEELEKVIRNCATIRENEPKFEVLGRSFTVDERLKIQKFFHSGHSYPTDAVYQQYLDELNEQQQDGNAITGEQLREFFNILRMQQNTAWKLPVHQNGIDDRQRLIGAVKVHGANLRRSRVENQQPSIQIEPQNSSGPTDQETLRCATQTSLQHIYEQRLGFRYFTVYPETIETLRKNLQSVETSMAEKEHVLKYHILLNILENDMQKAYSMLSLSTIVPSFYPTVYDEVVKLIREAVTVRPYEPNERICGRIFTFEEMLKLDSYFHLDSGSKTYQIYANDLNKHRLDNNVVTVEQIVEFFRSRLVVQNTNAVSFWKQQSQMQQPVIASPSQNGQERARVDGVLPQHHHDQQPVQHQLGGIQHMPQYVVVAPIMVVFQEVNRHAVYRQHYQQLDVFNGQNVDQDPEQLDEEPELPI